MCVFQLDRFIPISKLKYYFAVDTVYVGKKLGLLVFPYMHDVSLLGQFAVVLVVVPETCSSGLFVCFLSAV